jgi:hypothetical protein
MPVLAEPMEARLLRSVTSWTSDSISQPSGATYFGEVLFGDDGDPYGYPTTEAGQSDQVTTWSYTQWDSNLDDGLDSGWHTIALSINPAATGEGIWSVDGDNTTIAQSASGIIHQVTVQADVAGGQMEMDWKDLQIKFYRHGQLMETITPTSPTAGSLTSSSTDPAESGIVVTASASDCDGVVVTGAVRLQAAQGTYPGPTDIFGQIAVS